MQVASTFLAFRAENWESEGNQLLRLQDGIDLAMKAIKVVVSLSPPSNNLSGGGHLEKCCEYHSCESSCSATEIEAGVKEPQDVLQPELCGVLLARLLQEDLSEDVKCRWQGFFFIHIWLLPLTSLHDLGSLFGVALPLSTDPGWRVVTAPTAAAQYSVSGLINYPTQTQDMSSGAFSVYCSLKSTSEAASPSTYKTGHMA